MPAEKLYLAVDAGLPWPQRLVQAAHAAVMAARVMPELAANCAIVAVGAHGECELAALAAELGEGTVLWHEPDLGGALTAFAHAGTDRALRQLSLL